MGGRPLPIDSQTLLREQAWLYALARSLVGDAHAADDVVQETWLAALTGLPAGRERPQVRAFLGTVVRRVSSAWRRGEAQRELRERRASRSEGVAPESDALEWLALQRRLAEAIAELREPYRTAIVMRYVEGLAPGVIARRLRETPEAVRTRLSRGLEMLRKRLDREFGGERRAWHAVLGGLVLRRGPGTAALANTLAGALMGWKLCLVASALAIAVVGLWRWSREPRPMAGAAQQLAASEDPRMTRNDAKASATALPGVTGERTAATQETVRPASAALRGRVLALEDGHPLAGARVRLQLVTAERARAAESLQQFEAAIARGDHPAEIALRSTLEAQACTDVNDDSAAVSATTSGADGRFAFEVVPAGEHVLIATAEDRVATRVGEPQRFESREIEVTLAPVGSLEVELVDEAGAPLRGVHLAVRATQTLGPGVACFDELGGGDGFGPSDPRGRVRIDSLPCGVELRVESRPAQARGTRTAATTIDLLERHGSVQLVIPTAGALTGIVRPAPADGERVEARFHPRQPGTRPLMALVQPDGRFVLERLPAGPGRCEIALVHLGSRAATRTGVERAVTVRAGEMTDLGVLEVGAAARLAGHVPDWGASSSDDFIELRFLRDARTLARTTIDGEGRFEAWLSPGRCAIEVVHEERVLGVVSGHVPDDDLELDLLAFCAGLQGRVPESERGLRMLFPLLEPGDAADPARRISMRPLHGPQAVVDGEFRTLLLAPGRYSLLAPFGDRGAAWLPRLELERGRVLDVGELVHGFGAVQGRVVDEHGAPVSGAEVTLSSPCAVVLRTFVDSSAVTSDEGEFRVDGLPAGPWLATARTVGAVGTSAVADVFPGGSASLAVALRGSAHLSVRVMRNGEPVRDEPFRLVRAGGPELLEQRTSSAGRVDFAELAPDEWRWSLGAPASRSGKLVLRSGEQRTLDIDQGRAPVRFRLVSPSGGEVVDARAWSLDAERSGEMRQALLHGEDWFELDLEPGRYLIAAVTTAEQGTSAQRAIIDLVPDVHALDFVPSPLSLTVRAGSAERDASPPVVTLLTLAGVSVAGWGIPAPLTPIEDGWRCDSLPPGTSVRLSGALPGSGRAEREVFVSDDGTNEVDWP